MPSPIDKIMEIYGNPLEDRFTSGPVGRESLDEKALTAPTPGIDPVVGRSPSGRPQTASQRTAQQQDMRDAMNVALGFAGSTTPIRAWHGTPHVWAPEPGAPLGRFQPSQVGTGEGNAAFGYAPGGYYAGTRGISEGYRERLAPAQYMIEGKPLDLTNPKHLAAEIWERSEKDIATAANDLRMTADMDNKSIAWLEDRLAMGIDSGTTRQLYLDNLQQLYKRRDQLAEAKQHLLFPENLPPVDVQRAGALYEVNLHTNPEKLMLWDQPIGEQSPFVQEILNKIGKRDAQRYGEGGGADYYLGDPHSYAGENIYKYLAGQIGQPQATQMLQELGMPGMRHLNRAFREKPIAELDLANPEIYNYVMFDPKLVEVLRRYGLIPPAVGAASAAIPGSGAEAAEPQK
jgi:hypothetical protein